MSKKVPFMRSAYNYDVEEASNEATIKDNGESMTVQSMSEDADINVLMHRFGVTGKMPENVRIPTYGDFSGVTDFQSALHAIAEAQDSFMELPARLRARFENNPQLYLEFCADEKNVDEMENLGLLSKEAIERRREARTKAADAALAAANAAKGAK